MLSFIECLKHACSEGNLSWEMPRAKHINFSSLLVLDSPVGQRRLILPTPPHSNYWEALIWSDELHKRCVNCIGNISELQPGPRTTLTESVTFEYSDILIVYKTPGIYEWALKKYSFLSICLSVCLSCTSSTQPLLLKNSWTCVTVICKI